MEKELQNKAAKQLYQAFTELRTEAEVRSFLRDLCTVSEIKAMAERWQVAQAVEQKIPYRTISKQTGASTATVTRVAHWVHHGMGGYRTVLDRK